MQYTLKQATQTRPDKWNAQELSELSNTQLEALCLIMGFPKSGTKAQKIARLISYGSVFALLAPYQPKSTFDSTETAQLTQRLAHRFDGKTLSRLCKQVRAFNHSTKYGKAGSLISWRSTCLRRGLDAIAQAKADIQKRPKQLTLI